jgi:hypothetical protein
MMLHACVVKDTTVISLIQQDPIFKRMTPDDVLRKIINNEMLIEEAIHVQELVQRCHFLKKRRHCLQS